MIRISVREFQLHAKQYLKQLPVVLTQYNVDVATVTQVLTEESKSVNRKNTMIEESVNRSVTQVQEVVSMNKTGRCSPPLGYCKNIGVMTSYYTFDEEGRHQREAYLCPTHMILAKREEAKHE